MCMVKPYSSLYIHTTAAAQFFFLISVSTFNSSGSGKTQSSKDSHTEEISHC